MIFTISYDKQYLLIWVFHKDKYFLGHVDIAKISFVAHPDFMENFLNIFLNPPSKNQVDRTGLNYGSYIKS